LLLLLCGAASAHSPPWTSTTKSRSHNLLLYSEQTGRWSHEPSGGDSLTLQPPGSYLSNFAWTEPASFPNEFSDMAAACIDVALPVYWSNADPVALWSGTGLQVQLRRQPSSFIERETPPPWRRARRLAAGAKNSGGPDKARPTEPRASANGGQPWVKVTSDSLTLAVPCSAGVEVFHGISRAEGPSQQAGRPIAHQRVAASFWETAALTDVVVHRAGYSAAPPPRTSVGDRPGGLSHIASTDRKTISELLHAGSASATGSATNYFPEASSRS
jgi:hypothetical protein